MRDETIRIAHGSGGAESAELFQNVFAKHFHNDILMQLGDSAVVLAWAKENETKRLAVSTDSFVVTPLVFPGGDIGKLAVCGTVNDILMSGATPKWLTIGMIIEAGLPIALLDDLCASIAKTAAKAGIVLVAGDTKVIESHGENAGLMINTTGIGLLAARTGISPSGILTGDAVIISGNLGDHHAAILSARLGVKNNIKSDCALLTPITRALGEAGLSVHAMRDVTRGGLATVLNELADASGVSIVLDEKSIPVDPAVRSFCGLMGLDPLYMGNEGKAVFAVAPQDAKRALSCIRSVDIGQNAALIGFAAAAKKQKVMMTARTGGTVRIDTLYGEGLPRIC